MLTLDALCSDMETSDRYLSRRAARDWWTKGLLPRPHRRGLGRGRGTKTFWADLSVVQRAQAAYDLLAARPRADFALLGLWLLGFPVSLRSIRVIYRKVIARDLGLVRGRPGERPDDVVGRFAGMLARRQARESGAPIAARHALAELIGEFLEIFYGIDSEQAIEGFAALWERAAPYIGGAASAPNGLADLHLRDKDFAAAAGYVRTMASLTAQRKTIRSASDFELLRARRLILFVFGYLHRLASAAKCDADFEELGRRLLVVLGRPATPILIAVLRDDSLRHKIIAPFLGLLKDLPRPANCPHATDRGSIRSRHDV